MISASDEIDQVVRCIEIGAEDFLPKPFNPILLKARIGAALDKKRFRDRERKYLQQVEIYSQKLNQELEKGRQMQLNFLPTELLQIPNWEISAFFKPARQVAGDFYDTFQVMENHVGLVIADVCDKGVGAALFMALFRSLIRIFAAQTVMRNLYKHIMLDSSGTDLNSIDSIYISKITPTDVLEAVSLANNYVAEYHGELGMFATLFFGVLDPETGLLHYINGGHEPLFVIDLEGKIQQKLKSTGPAVGMMPNMKFKIEQAHLKVGDILVGYTDGVPEARNLSGEFFTDQRLLNILTKPISSVNELLNEITEKVINHIGNADQFDDITLLAIQRN
jgi:two-component system response regulator